VSVYVANSRSNTVSQYDVGAGGVLTPKSPAMVAAGTAPYGVAVSQNGASVYVANLLNASVSQYDVGAGGVLTPKSPATVGTSGSQPVGVAVSPNGASVYVTNSGTSTVAQYDVGGGGVLTPKSPPTLAAGTNPSGVAVSPGGASVYVANSGSNDVSQYDVGAGGALAPESPATVGAGSAPAAVAVSLGPAPPYPIPGNATPLHVPLVQVFRQCGIGGNPVNAKHAPTLGLGSCNPPVPVSPNARVGNGGSDSVTMTVLSGDYQIAVLDSDVRTPAGSDYDPNGGAGNDLRAVAKLRITDTNNCTPSGCSGPYTQSATTTDFDFGPVPINCVTNANASTPPGSDCNVTTTANAVTPGTLVAGKLTSITVFRLRINDHLNTLFQQQGILIP
jgi:DNA-binding beta-propeller fold protein YncE